MKSLNPRQCEVCGEPSGKLKTCSAECLGELKSRTATKRRKELGYGALGYYSVWNDGKI